MSSSKRRIYTLNEIPPEKRAVTFARCSRSSEPFDKIAEKTDKETSRRFHEKYVLGFGHSSVAEHATVSLAIENVSILATKSVIEENRLCSYTERSTRYQLFDKDNYYKPKRVLNSELGEVYTETADYILDTYTSLFDPMMKFMKRKYPKDPDTSDRLYEIKIKNKAFDVLRYMLPVSVLTSLGMTANARSLAYAINKLLSHPLEEVQEIGKEIKEASKKVVPTLVKKTEPKKFLKETPKDMKKLTNELVGSRDSKEEQRVELVEYDDEAEDKVVTSLLYRFSDLPYQEVKDKVKNMSEEEKEKVIETSLKNREGMELPLREFEHVYYTFDVTMDYGSFRDLQRHRMCTQTHQECTTRHGYTTPEEIVEAGLKGKYDECMKRAREAYDKLYEEFPNEAKYITPLSFLKRTLFTFNLREAYHLITLRTTSQGHKSYRRIAAQMYKEIKKVHPLLAKYIRVNLEGL